MACLPTGVELAEIEVWKHKKALTIALHPPLSSVPTYLEGNKWVVLGASSNSQETAIDLYTSSSDSEDIS